MSTDSAADERVSGWSTEVRRVVRLMAGDWVDTAEREWDQHAASERVLVTVHGVYNAGKSSLLKRILVEDGTECPPWLAIGARPTTFDVHRVESGGLVWVDTPGTGTGDERHDRLGADALVLTDAVLVVLNPQLQHEDVRQVLAQVDGTFYTAATRRPLFPDGALVVAVGLMDAAGVSAEDDLDGYRDLVSRKEQQLRAALAGPDRTSSPPTLHFVAADPDHVGRRPHPAPADYAASSGWDGVAALRRDLGALGGRIGELRPATEVRFWSHLADRARRAATEESEQLTAVLGEAQRQRERVRLWLDQLDTIDRAARVKLQELLYRDITTVGVRVTDAQASRVLIEEQVTATVAAWSADFGGQLDKLAREASTELRAQLERPAAGALRRYLDELSDVGGVVDTERGGAVHRLIGQFETHAKSVARGGYKLLHGLSVEEARTELTHLRQLDAENQARYFARAKTPFADADQARATELGLRRLEVVEDLLPVVLELASAITADVRDSRVEQRRREARENAGRHAELVTARVLHGGDELNAWVDAVAGLREGLGSLGPDEPIVADAVARRQLLDDVVDALTALLAEPPRVVGRAG